MALEEENRLCRERPAPIHIEVTDKTPAAPSREAGLAQHQQWLLQVVSLCIITTEP